MLSFKPANYYTGVTFSFQFTHDKYELVHLILCVLANKPICHLWERGFICQKKTNNRNMYNVIQQTNSLYKSPLKLNYSHYISLILSFSYAALHNADKFQ